MTIRIMGEVVGISGPCILFSQKMHDKKTMTKIHAVPCSD